jgi:SAM-dependent methyltransferase
MLISVPTDIPSKLRQLVRLYPESLQQDQLQDVDRIAYHIELVLETAGPRARVCDIGGGTGLFSLGCAALGLRATLVDDFNDPVNHKHGSSALAPHQQHGVTILSRNVIDDPLEIRPGGFDAITSFDSMEHWHNSPKQLFRTLMGGLKPGGLFLLGVPNSVNLRKRITVPLGRGKWSQMADWYEPDVFRGHVREPDVDDLLYIARDLHLERVRIMGRNWQARRYSSILMRTALPVADLLLRPFPSLCSDLYLLGSKAQSS